MSLTFDSRGRPIHFPNNPTFFEFDEEVASIFQDMATRSIPGYISEKNLIISIINQYLSGKNDRLEAAVVDKKNVVVDVGCSDGELFCRLVHECMRGRLHGNKTILNSTKMVGLDTSRHMIAKASDKIPPYGEISYMLGSIDRLPKLLEGYGKASIIVASYVLQFIKEGERFDSYRVVYEGLEPGGILLLSEKEAESGLPRMLDEYLRKAYIDFREYNGYSKEEIQRKTEALSNGSMVPWARSSIISVLHSVGFSVVENIHRWGKFATYLAIK